MSKNILKIELPLEDWEDQTIYSFKGPTIEGTDHNMLLAIDRVLMHDAISSFAKSKMDIIEENLSNIVVLKKGETTIPEGNPVYEYLLEWTPSDKWRCYKKYVFVIHESRGYTFTLDFSLVSYPLLNKQMKTIIDSLVPGTFKK